MYHINSDHDKHRKGRIWHRNMLLLHGDEELKDEATINVVAEVVKHLKSDSFTNADVKRYHRMDRQISNKKPITILFKFSSRTAYSLVKRSWKHLRLLYPSFCLDSDMQHSSPRGQNSALTNVGPAKAPFTSWVSMANNIVFLSSEIRTVTSVQMRRGSRWKQPQQKQDPLCWRNRFLRFILILFTLSDEYLLITYTTVSFPYFFYFYFPRIFLTNNNIVFSIINIISISLVKQISTAFHLNVWILILYTYFIKISPVML